MRRKAPTLPNNNGGASSGYDQYGASSGGAGYSQGQGYGTSHGTSVNQQGGAPGGGYSYGNSNTNTNQNTGGGGGSSSGGSSYSGYGNSSGGGGFGVGMGEAYGGEYGTSSKGKKKKTAAPISFRFIMDKFIITVVLALLFLGATIFYRSQYKIILEKFHVQSIMDAVKSYDKLEVEKKRYQKESLSYKESDRQLKNSMRDLEKTNRDLKKKQEELKLKFDAVGGGMGLEESDKLKAREEAWKKQVQLLQNATQRESKRAVMERFGPGPHHVLFTVAIPDAQDKPQMGTFQVELAPLDEMPHANHLFLQQVYHELWDSTWFYLNGPHVLQAGPQDWEEDTAGQSLKRFTETKLDKLSFPEYSAQFPHVEWTMGFTGRPGGPDWYINKVDNTKPHGPGGQFQHDLEEQADSCFAKIVDGKDTLQTIMNLDIYPRGSDYAYFLEEPIEIVSARIMESIRDDVQKPKQNALPNNAAARKVQRKAQRLDVNQEARDILRAEQMAGLMDSIQKSVVAEK